MRILRFTVDAQKISPDPDCDFSGLVSGTAGYLKASFKFSKEWSGMVKESRTGGVMVKEPKYWYKWTKTGKKLNRPIDGFNHLMDAMRYAFEDISKGDAFSFD